MTASLDEETMPPIRVLQSVKRWLPRTQKWLHRQVCSLPAEIESKIACRETVNLDAFRVPRIGAFDHRSAGIRPVDTLLDLARSIPIVERTVDAWALRRRTRWRSEFARDVELVHSHFGPVAWRDLPVVETIDARHVATFYGYDCSLLPTDEPIWRERYAELFEAVDRVLCEGPHMRQTVVDLGCPPEKVEVHRLGVAVDEIEFRPRRREEDAPVRFLIASSFTPKKGIPDGIEAFGRLAGDRNFEVTIVGDATYVERTQREKERIEAAVDEHDLRDRIEFTGFLPYEELVDAFLSHDVLVAPSRETPRGDSEGGAPVTMIAAQATGMPVVSTTHADIPEVVADGETGFLAPEYDVAGFTDALRQAIDAAGRWPEMGRAARERVESRFDARTQAQQLAERYRRIVQR